MDDMSKAYSAVDMICCIRVPRIEVIERLAGCVEISDYGLHSGIKCFEYDLQKYDTPETESEFGRYRFALDSLRIFAFENGICLISTRFISLGVTDEIPEIFRDLGYLVKNITRRAEVFPAFDIVSSIIDSLLRENEELLYIPPTREAARIRGFKAGSASTFMEYTASLEEDGNVFVYYQVAVDAQVNDEEMALYIVKDDVHGNTITVTDAMHSISNGCEIKEQDPDPIAIKFLSKNLGASVSRLGVGFVRRDSHVDKEIYERYLYSFSEVLERMVCFSCDSEEVHAALKSIPKDGDEIARAAIREAESIRSDMAAYRNSGNKSHAFQSYYLSTIGFENDLAYAAKMASDLLSAAAEKRKDKENKKERNLQLTMNIVAILAVTSFFKDGSDIVKEVFRMPESSLFILFVLLLDALATIGMIIFLFLYNRK